MYRLKAGLVLLPVFFALSGCDSSGPSPGTASKEPPAAANAGPAIEKKADDALRAMSNLLSAAQTFRFNINAMIDEETADGKEIQVERKSRILVRRPDAVASDVQGDKGAWLFRYHGKTLSVMSKDHGKYATVEVPSTIDKMLDFLFDNYDLTIPVADLAFPNPYAAMTEDVESGVYVGLHEVEGHSCHHLLFTQKNVDWQIWVDAGDKPLPRKLVITQKNEPGEPQYTAVLSGWDLAATAADSEFEFKAPAGAKAIDMAALLKERGE